MKRIAFGLCAGILAFTTPVRAQDASPAPAAPDRIKNEQAQKPQDRCLSWGFSSTDVLNIGMAYALPSCVPEASRQQDAQHAAAPAAAFARTEQPQWQQDEDHQACLAKDLVQGTDAYDRCRVQMSDSRIQQDLARAARLTAYFDWEESGTSAGSFHGEAQDVLLPTMPYSPGSYLGSQLQNQPAQEATTATTVCSTEGIGADEKKSCDTHVMIERKAAATPTRSGPPTLTRFDRPQGMSDLMWGRTSY